MEIQGEIRNVSPRSTDANLTEATFGDRGESAGQEEGMIMCAREEKIPEHFRYSFPFTIQ